VSSTDPKRPPGDLWTTNRPHSTGATDHFGTVNEADVAAEEAEGRRFRAMARRHQNSPLHALDQRGGPGSIVRAHEAAVQTDDDFDELHFADGPPPLVDDHAPADGDGDEVYARDRRGTVNEPVAWPADQSSGDDESEDDAYAGTVTVFF